jgi:hypothetical protein
MRRTVAVALPIAFLAGSLAFIAPAGATSSSPPLSPPLYFSPSSHTASTITLSWSPLGGSVGKYWVYSCSKTTCSPLASTKGTSYTVKGLKSSTGYVFQLKAWKGSKTVAQSGRVSAYTRTSTGAVEKLLLKQINAHWDLIDKVVTTVGLGGYYSLPSGGTCGALGNATSTTEAFLSDSASSDSQALAGLSGDLESGSVSVSQAKAELLALKGHSLPEYAVIYKAAGVQVLDTSDAFGSQTWYDVTHLYPALADESVYKVHCKPLLSLVNGILTAVKHHTLPSVFLKTTSAAPLSKPEQFQTALVDMDLILTSQNAAKEQMYFASYGFKFHADYLLGTTTDEYLHSRIQGFLDELQANLDDYTQGIDQYTQGGLEVLAQMDPTSSVGMAVITKISVQEISFRAAEFTKDAAVANLNLNQLVLNP